MKNTGKHSKKGFMSKERVYGRGIPIPKPLPYSILMAKLQQLDMGDVISVREILCHDLPVDQQVAGVYRNLQNLLLMLCKFYFETDEYRNDNDKLTWFGEREGTFQLAIGGDGAPFGKRDGAMSSLISFSNVGPRVASPNDKFLLFGANCKEDHQVIVKFTEKLPSDIEAMPKKTNTVMGKEVTFSFDLLPEKYSSTIANVSQDNRMSLSGKFGETPDSK